MPRIRLAVALLIPQPAATEIDGMRRALGDGALPSVVPHITLIPPVNVAEDRVPEVLASVRAAAAEVAPAPLQLRLGPPVTFAPVTPVVYLDVGGVGDVGDVGGSVDNVRELRNALLTGALARPATHEFVPHVTIADDCAPDRIDAALHALRDYTFDVQVGRVHVLRDHSEGPHRWNPVADALFEPPLIVGRGGWQIELTVSSLADPQVAPWFVDLPVTVPPGAEPVVVVARHEREIVAAARGWTIEGEPTFVEIVGDLDVERQLLKAATQSAAGRA